MKRVNKYNYLLVIQQNCAGYWEDVSEYAVNSQYLGGEHKDWKHDVKEYRLMGYPTRTIKRRELTPPPNGYDIRFNPLWDKWIVSHDEIGAGLAEFKEYEDAFEYCQKG